MPRYGIATEDDMTDRDELKDYPCGFVIGHMCDEDCAFKAEHREDMICVWLPIYRRHIALRKRCWGT